MLFHDELLILRSCRRPIALCGGQPCQAQDDVAAPAHLFPVQSQSFFPVPPRRFVIAQSMSRSTKIEECVRDPPAIGGLALDRQAFFQSGARGEAVSLIHHQLPQRQQVRGLGPTVAHLPVQAERFLESRPCLREEAPLLGDLRHQTK